MAYENSMNLCLLQTKWMMYWIVFAIFLSVEVLTDTFLAWYVVLSGY